MRRWFDSRHRISEKGLSSPVWTTLRPWVGTLSCWPSLATFANPMREILQNPQLFSKRLRGISLVLVACALLDALITRITAVKEPLCGNAAVYTVVIVIVIAFTWCSLVWSRIAKLVKWLQEQLLSTTLQPLLDHEPLKFVLKWLQNDVVSNETRRAF